MEGPASTGLLVFVIVAEAFLIPSSVAAHGGGLNRQGCHNERATGGYHCHRSSYTPPPRTSPEPTRRREKARPVAPTGQAFLSAPATKMRQQPQEQESSNLAPRALISTDRTKSSSILVSEAVREAQGYLIYLGYSLGNADGLVGPKTRAALTAYQRTRGLAPDGVVSDALLDKMATEISGGGAIKDRPAEVETASGNLIERHQFYLKLLALYSGPLDGISSVALEQAIIRFQSSNRISVDGKASESLLSKIKAAVF